MAVLVAAVALIGCGSDSPGSTVTQGEALKEKEGGPPDSVARDESPPTDSPQKAGDPAKQAKPQREQGRPRAEERKEKRGPTAEAVRLPDELVEAIDPGKRDEPLTEADLERMADQIKAKQREIQEELESGSP